MSNPIKIVAVAAMSNNRVIGKGGVIPWRVKSDFQHWRNMSRGKVVIMGRKTFEDMPPQFQKRPHIIVITRDKNWSFNDVIITHGIEEAFKAAYKICDETHKTEIIIGGGAEIYAQALPQTEAVYLTTIDTTVENGDALFPILDESEWQAVDDLYEFEEFAGDTATATMQKYIRI